jgi:ATP-dependent helicase/nuclease subunit B
MRHGVARVIAERMGAIDLAIAGESFRLSCRADRIDLLADGGARILDYKTGAVPTKKQVESGLSPQLTLQAAILARGGFRDVEPRQTGEIGYVHITGGDPAGELEPIKLSVMDVAEKHLAELEKLLIGYASQSQPYLPRNIMEKEDDEGDYDHLSRFREWALSGGGA